MAARSPLFRDGGQVGRVLVLGVAERVVRGPGDPGDAPPPHQPMYAVGVSRRNECGQVAAFVFADEDSAF